MQRDQSRYLGSLECVLRGRGQPLGVGLLVLRLRGWRLLGLLRLLLVVTCGWSLLVLVVVVWRRRGLYYLWIGSVHSLSAQLFMEKGLSGQDKWHNNSRQGWQGHRGPGDALEPEELGARRREDP